MDEYCREKGFAGWFETSAKENINIEEAARSLVNKVTIGSYCTLHFPMFLPPGTEDWPQVD